MSDVSKTFFKDGSMSLKSLMSTMFLFTISIIVTIFNVASADEYTIVTITSDENESVYKLIIDTHDERAIKRFYKDIYEKGQKIKRIVLDHNMFESGLILEKRSRYEVIKLSSANFDFEQGGTMIIDTLYNGASGERKTYEVEVAKDKSGWAIFNKGKTIKSIKIQTNRIIILGAVGIKNLVMK